MNSSNFIKHNNTNYPDALKVEAQGLRFLSAAIDESDSGLAVPKIYRQDPHILELERIESQPFTQPCQFALGRELARMHRKRHPQYGLDYDNMIGLNRQLNVWSSNWGLFFLEQRLKPQIRLIKEPGLRRRYQQQLEVAEAQLVEFLNRHCCGASALHGDLWFGNVMRCSTKIWLIDPAVYWGDAEVDLAMTTMFGGFNQAFYEGYASVTPLSEVFELKRDIYNLYHYLNHLNLFGLSYQDGCDLGFARLATL
jgi:fructosamine-3-kinase